MEQPNITLHRITSALALILVILKIISFLVGHHNPAPKFPPIEAPIRAAPTAEEKDAERQRRELFETMSGKHRESHDVDPAK